MHLMQKCIFATHQMHFGIKCICNILFCKNAFLHQQNVRIKCIFASNAFVTFYWCVALLNIFPLENVQHQQNVRTAFVFCCALFFYFLRCVHFPKENVQHLCFLQSKKHSIFAKSNVRNAKSKKTPNTAFLQGKYFQVEILVNILQSKMYAKIDSNILVFCQAHLSHIYI